MCGNSIQYLIARLPHFRNKWRISHTVADTEHSQLLKQLIKQRKYVWAFDFPLRQMIFQRYENAWFTELQLEWLLLLLLFVHLLTKHFAKHILWNESLHFFIFELE